MMAATGPARRHIRAEGIEKSFGPVRALAGADIDLAPGDVHGLMGVNGSGKSTLLRVLSGQLRADAGRLFIDDEPVVLRTPADALRRGIAIVSQESSLAPDLSVAENVLMGRRLVKRYGLVSRTASQRRAMEVLDLVGYRASADQPVARLRPDERQLVEIARALSFDTRLLILDESTSSLTADEVGRLDTLISRLTSVGATVLLVSHRMAEIEALCDSVTVLRDGRTVATGPLSSFTADSLVTWMTGVAGPARAPEARLPSAGSGGLRLVRYRVPGVAQGIDLDVPAGTIVGLHSHTESVRTALLRSLFGMAASLGGRAEVDGVPFRPAGPREAMRAGVGYVSADRRTDGFVPDLSIADNIALSATRGRARGRLRDGRAERALAAGLVHRMSIAAPSLDVAVRSLSGGNQQKVVLGRSLALAPRVLLLDEPTRGVDVRSKREIHDLLRDAAATGAAVLVSSSEDEELLAFCDRIAVITDGALVATLDASRTTLDDLAGHATGARS